MIWIIFIVAYLLLVALAFGFLIEADDKEQWGSFKCGIVACTIGWIILPFIVFVLLGRILASYLNNNY